MAATRRPAQCDNARRQAGKRPRVRRHFLMTLVSLAALAAGCSNSSPDQSQGGGRGGPGGAGGRGGRGGRGGAVIQVQTTTPHRISVPRRVDLAGTLLS